MNVKLLESMKKRILKNNKRFNMRFWGVSCKNGEVTDQLEKPSCNTQACFAGEAVLAGKVAKIDRKNGGIVLISGESNTHIALEAVKVLDLNKEQAGNLFYFSRWISLNNGYGHGWPKEFEEKYHSARTSAERAQVAAERIDHFIHTNGE